MPLPSLREQIAEDMDLFDNIENVSVAQVDPDTGITIQTATDVVALARAIDAGFMIVGDGGEVPKRSGRIHLKASSIAFEPKRRDVITLADGTNWKIENAKSVTLNTRYACDVVSIP